MYRWAVIVPRIKSKRDLLPWAIAAYTTTATVWSTWRSIVNVKLLHSPRSRLTVCRPSWAPIENLGASEKTTCYHWRVQCSRCLHHSRRRWRWFGIMGAPNASHKQAPLNVGDGIQYAFEWAYLLLRTIDPQRIEWCLRSLSEGHD
jgi:hypothetical protein